MKMNITLWCCLVQHTNILDISNPRPFVPLFSIYFIYHLKKILNSPVVKRFQVTFQGRDPVERMRREPGCGAVLGFDLDVASYISAHLSLQRQRKSNRVSFIPGLASHAYT